MQPFFLLPGNNHLRNQMVSYIFVTERLQKQPLMRRDVFQAIADPVRRDIIGLLAKEPLTVNQIAQQFEISRPAISKHIRILDECGLVSVEQKGRERFCMIKPSRLVPAFLWVEQYKSLWEDRIDSFEAYLNTLNEDKNE